MDRLKQQLKTLGWSQRALAEKTGYNYITVNRWLNGHISAPKALYLYLDAMIAIREFSENATGGGTIMTGKEWVKVNKWEMTMADHKPAEIIEQARDKAKRAILEVCGTEVQRICDAFSYDTGFSVNKVEVELAPSTTLSMDGMVKNNIAISVKIDHESV